MSSRTTAKTAYLAMGVALAMILSFVESQIPPLVAIPGVKMGLANIVVVFLLYKLGWKETLTVSLIRVLLVGLLFGSGVSVLYSLAGAAVSFLGMLVLKGIKVFSCMAVSVAGGVLHNLGQLAVAWLIVETDALTYYIPFLLLSGTLAGVVIGVLAAIMIQRIRIGAPDNENK